MPSPDNLGYGCRRALRGWVHLPELMLLLKMVAIIPNFRRFGVSWEPLWQKFRFSDDFQRTL